MMNEITETFKILHYTTGEWAAWCKGYESHVIGTPLAHNPFTLNTMRNSWVSGHRFANLHPPHQHTPDVNSDNCPKCPHHEITG